jgi:phosphoserine phosphatase
MCGLMTNESPEDIDLFLNRFRSVRYAIFDFDGTIYPRLFLFDLTKKIFTDQGANNKLEKLNLIAKLYKQGTFVKAYNEFIELLKGEDRNLFKANTEEMMNTTYSYARLTVEKMHDKYNIQSYLISLTSDFISEVVKDTFPFEEVFSIKYLSDVDDDRIVFNGKIGGQIKDQQEMKQTMINALLSSRPEIREEGYACFFDSRDDIPVAKSAMLKVGVNPSKELVKEINFDLILSGNDADPWKSFYEML